MVQTCACSYPSRRIVTVLDVSVPFLDASRLFLDTSGLLLGVSRAIIGGCTVLGPCPTARMPAPVDCRASLCRGCSLGLGLRGWGFTAGWDGPTVMDIQRYDLVVRVTHQWAEGCRGGERGRCSERHKESKSSHWSKSNQIEIVRFRYRLQAISRLKRCVFFVRCIT